MPGIALGIASLIVTEGAQRRRLGTISVVARGSQAMLCAYVLA